MKSKKTTAEKLENSKKCVAPDCDRDAIYKKKQLCQKHYFRLYRYGTLELKNARERIIAPNGYVRIHRRGHPLSDSNTGYVFEHRYVAYEARQGKIEWCERCGMVKVAWNTCHVDHDDLSITNNSPENLVVSCIGCNTRRCAPFRGVLLTACGETKGYRAWSADPRVIVAEKTIRNRKACGLSDHDAIFTARATHTSSPPAKVVKNKFEGGKRISV